eukprot:11164304-Lingulodinium_polyedra.AAC.1
MRREARHRGKVAARPSGKGKASLPSDDPVRLRAVAEGDVSDDDYEAECADLREVAQRSRMETEQAPSDPIAKAS